MRSRVAAHCLCSLGSTRTPDESRLPSVGGDTSALLAVIDDVRAALRRPGNDFSWSSFADVDAALNAIDEVATKIRSGEPVPFMLHVLFAPTGPIQEVALASGWSHEYHTFADRIDAVTRR